MRPLLIGEDNPYGSDPRFALYPRPVHSAGGRLCHRVLQLTEKEYLGKFDRVNLCVGKWSIKEARRSAASLLIDRGDLQDYVLLGSKVCAAFDTPFEPFTVQWRDTPVGGAMVVLPHPSGLSRLWNEPDSYEKARAVLRKAEILP